MTFRLTPVLCILLLAGCTSSEPLSASYAPVAAPAMTMPPPASPSATAAPTTAAMPVHDTIAPSALAEQAPPAAASSAQASFDPLASTEQTLADQVVPPGATNCSTVDGVTLCDAPYDPNADSTRYTN